VGCQDPRCCRNVRTRPLFTRPPETAFPLLESACERRDGGLLPASQRLMEDFSVRTRRDPERFPARFAAVAPHPGALTVLGLGPNGHRREIDIYPQPVLMEPMMGGGPIAFEIIPGHSFKLRDIFFHRSRAQRARDGRLVRTRRTANGTLHGGVCTNRHVTLGNSFGAAEDPA
jgi:hypothetical protein